jgi:hypothetical protein
MSAATALLLGAVLYIDYVTGPVVDLDFLYILPILSGGWYLGYAGGFVAAVATTATWSAMRIIGLGFIPLGAGVAVWNALMRFSVHWTVAYLLSRSRFETFAVRAALERSRRLPELIPICAWCRKMRDAHEEWQTLEQFLAKETDVRLTHGICQSCAERLRRESEELEARSPST